MSERCQSLVMQEADWSRLIELATKTESTFSGKASWRRMMLRIARGEITLRINRSSTSRLQLGEQIRMRRLEREDFKEWGAS